MVFSLLHRRKDNQITFFLMIITLLPLPLSRPWRSAYYTNAQKKSTACQLTFQIPRIFTALSFQCPGRRAGRLRDTNAPPGLGRTARECLIYAFSVPSEYDGDLPAPAAGLSA
jgi:hypothetical protein